ncbi:hypothetical protein B0H16DRAFT_1666372 [Mycena metata]|uniref:CxC2-like cysteine cluster KDZ transposase-associated domain-containing protein n=1 Tax=Mycena metata TaxID=1033252 RepID=A0AAD7HHY9_9AGAR|nr:hypothetical protein B0H16DRAFT_1666372 [Mycena metata]
MFVDRPSGDVRRVYRTVVPIAPPSPIKNARRGDMNQGSSSSETAPTGPVFDLGADERYEMGDGLEDTPMQQPPAVPGARRRTIFSVRPTLYDWKVRLRTRYLQELLRRDGCGDASKDRCPQCQRSDGAKPRYRCKECAGDLLYCRECFIARHKEHPLHTVEAWNGACFVSTSIQALGLRVQFGHLPGESCGNPSPGRKRFVVLHDNGVHEVAVDYCGCEHLQRAGPPDIQLLRGGWYPASEKRPQTCMTLTSLDRFHVETLQAKTTMYDYYKSLEMLTVNDGRKPLNRYQVFIRICREYRHLMMLKRGGRGHDEGGVEGTKPGQLAILCPACPQPGINLPVDWDKASKEDRFMYILFLALDVCFRLKRGLVSSELKDPGLGTGWSYVTENVPYRKYLLTVTDQKEMSTCSGLAALDYANTKFSRGYSTTGVGMGVCARHKFVQPTGVGDLQKGERYANIVGSILCHHDPLLRKTISYDIVCQWWKQLMQRLALLPPLVCCFLILQMVAFVIPKLHIHGHTVACGNLYSLNLIPGSGQTDGEGIERPWSNIGGIASSTRIMGPGARHDTVDNHWSHWNWQKLILLGTCSVRRLLDNAWEQRVIQREAFEAFSEQQQERVPGWKKMVEEFEDDPKKKNPYEAVVKGLTENEVRLQFQQEDEADARARIPAKHKVSAGTFMGECLDVEEEQRRIRVQAELKKAQSTAQQIDMGALRTALIRRLERLRKMQDTYSPASIVALQDRDAPLEELPKDEPLFLPSMLSEEQRLTGCSTGLLEKERRLRDAQCRTSLVRLRNQLHIKARFLNYKKLHARHQGANTRARTIVNRNESKIRLHSEKYQAAWRALVRIAGGDELKVVWKKLRKSDIRKRGGKKRSRDGRGKEEEEEGPNRRGAGESRREVSWIWTAAGTSGTDTDLEDALRIEWAKSYARMRRWEEEVRLLEEEFRRLPISLEFQAARWDDRGMIAYAVKQAALFRDIARRAKATQMAPTVPRGKRGPREPILDPLAPSCSQPAGIPGEDGESDDGGDDDENVRNGEEDDDEEERGVVESDEELLMGGEVDD